MDELARSLDIACGDGIGRQQVLDALSDVAPPVIDGFLTIDEIPKASNELFAVLANP